LLVGPGFPDLLDFLGRPLEFLLQELESVVFLLGLLLEAIDIGEALGIGGEEVVEVDEILLANLLDLLVLI
jgi:hypothetical protein